MSFFPFHVFAPRGLGEAIDAAVPFARRGRIRMRVELCRDPKCTDLLGRHWLITPSPMTWADRWRRLYVPRRKR